MSRYFTYDSLSPYTPGEQPKDNAYLKLNTNESPFLPSPRALSAVKKAEEKLNLYADPECTKLKEALCAIYPIEKDEVIFTNGSDEALNFAFMAFSSKEIGAAFADITYGFYPVFSALHGVPYTEIPLRDDFSIDVEDYLGINKTIFIANPNAPTGRFLPLSDIERILKANPDNVVVVDEAYIDFGGESAVGLIRDYENLLVIQTFSKSRCLAGGRLGFAIGNEKLIRDLNTLKYSTNPYNVNALTMALGEAILKDEETTKSHIETIKKNRKFLIAGLTELGFEVIPSSANFVFARHRTIPGETLYRKLKEKGVLVRYFSSERIKDYNRITVAKKEQMETLLKTIKEILEESDENC